MKILKFYQPNVNQKKHNTHYFVDGVDNPYQLKKEKG